MRPVLRAGDVLATSTAVLRHQPLVNGCRWYMSSSRLKPPAATAKRRPLRRRVGRRARSAAHRLGGEAVRARLADVHRDAGGGSSCPTVVARRRLRDHDTTLARRARLRPGTCRCPSEFGERSRSFSRSGVGSSRAVLLAQLEACPDRAAASELVERGKLRARQLASRDAEGDARVLPDCRGLMTAAACAVDAAASPETPSATTEDQLLVGLCVTPPRARTSSARASPVARRCR